MRIIALAPHAGILCGVALAGHGDLRRIISLRHTNRHPTSESKSLLVSMPYSHGIAVYPTLRDKRAQCGLALFRHRIIAALVAALSTAALSAEAGVPCLAAGEPVQWITDYCMLKMETDDEIAVSGCIEEQARIRFRNACASNTHFKKRMCERMIRNGTRTGTLDRCLKDPKFKGRTVAAGGVGA